MTRKDPMRFYYADQIAAILDALLMGFEALDRGDVLDPKDAAYLAGATDFAEAAKRAFQPTSEDG